MTGQRKPRIGRLTTVGEVTVEIGKIYRAARHEKIGTADAKRLSDVLRNMREGMVTSDIERRIEELEGGIERGDGEVSNFPSLAVDNV